MKRFLSLIVSLLFCTAISAQDGIKFKFTCDGNPLQLNQMIYKSKRGLTYQVAQCQYFISDIVDGNLTFSNERQEENALEPIVVTPSGTSILLKYSLFANAFWLIPFTATERKVEGITTS